MSDKKHELFMDYTFLIALHFDNGVKMFIQNILLGKGKDKVEVSHFSYRVEFQARGLPHIHGVAWIAKHELAKRGLTGNLMDNELEALKLVDELVTCKIPDNDEQLKKIVLEVQQHKHTKSCLKYNGVCRYDFPRLPSPHTIVAKPIEETHPHLSEKEQIKKKQRAVKVLKKAKELLNDPNFDDLMSLEDFYDAI